MRCEEWVSERRVSLAPRASLPLYTSGVEVTRRAHLVAWGQMRAVRQTTPLTHSSERTAPPLPADSGVLFWRPLLGNTYCKQLPFSKSYVGWPVLRPVTPFRKERVSDDPRS